MFGTGLPEFIIILLVVLLLFGPAVLTFWLGYVMGSNRAAESGQSPDVERKASSDDDVKEHGDE